MGKRKQYFPSPPPPPPKKRQRGARGQLSISALPPEMLEKILDFLPLDDLKTARMVNKTWRKVAVAPIRKKSDELWLYLVDYKFMSDFYDNLVQNSDDFPVDKFYIFLHSYKGKYCKTRSSYLTSQKHKGELVLDEIFRMISPWVTQLGLGFAGTSNNINVANLPGNYYYPKLKQLRIQLTDWSPQEWRRRSKLWDSCSSVIRGIMENSPNLEGVILEIRNLDHKSIATRFITDVFQTGGRMNFLTKINAKKYDPRTDCVDWLALSGMDLKLRELKVKLSPSTDVNKSLTTFLESQSKSLVNLKMSMKGANWRLQRSVELELPRMEKLEIFEIQYAFGEDDDDDEDFDEVEIGMSEILITIKGFSFKKLLPSLKKLHLCKGVQWQDFFKHGLAPIKTMEDLRFPMNILQDVTPTPVLLAAEIFPNLKKLHTLGHPVIMNAIYENMPGLEELTVFNASSGSFDPIITGLTESECSSFKRLSKKWTEKLDNSKANGKSLECLENLRTLRLREVDIRNGDDQPLFGNDNLLKKPAVEVLKRMSSLKSIDLFDGMFENPHLLGLVRRHLLIELMERFKVL